MVYSFQVVQLMSFLKTNFNIILRSMPSFLRWYFPFRFTKQELFTSICVILICHPYNMPTHVVLLGSLLLCGTKSGSFSQSNVPSCIGHLWALRDQAACGMKTDCVLWCSHHAVFVIPFHFFPLWLKY
jgi:hypothetical protein